jgi:transglutaminase/protease-like cytokinesis protein 3
MLSEAVPTVMGNQAFLPLYKQMIDSVVATLPSARQYASAIDATFNQIAQQLAQPQPQQPDPELIKAQAEVQKNQNEFQVKQEANAIKQEEVELKKQAEDNKVMMADKEAKMQYALKEQELAIKGATNENITTGYVGAF